MLYRVVRDHFETFCLQSASLRGGEGLPRFVREEFRAYLRCGWLAAGFARFRCPACGADRLVAFSCKGRGFCPSCGSRRMTALTAHLADRVFPPVPVRQWVLSLPHRLRYLLAWDHDLCRAVTAVFLRAVMGFLRDRAAAVLGRAAIGPRSGAPFRRVGDERGDGNGTGASATACRARRCGFDLHAGVVAPAAHRHRLERLCRYGLRPPVAEERLQMTPDGQVLLRLRHRWSDGTTHILFEPTEFLERLAAITPRPRVNLVLYYGVLAPRAARRAAVVGEGAAAARSNADRRREGSGAHAGAGGRPSAEPPTASWAALMRRAFGFDVLACPRCGHRMRLIALIDQADVIRRNLRHLREPTEVPPPAPARPPPLLAAGEQGLARGEAHGLTYDREPAPDCDDPC